MIAGLEPQQRFPATERPRGNFSNGPDRGGRSFGGGAGGYAGRKPAGGGYGGGGGGGGGGGFGGNRNDRGGDRGQERAPFQAQPGQGFNDRNFADRAPRRPDDRVGFGGDRGGNYAPREERNFAPRDDRNFGARNEGFAPRPDFAARKPGFARPAGKVFVPRDAAKKGGKFSKPARDLPFPEG